MFNAVNDEESDSRLDFLFDYLSRSLRVKLDKWQRMMNSEEYRTTLYDFFDREDIRLLTICLGPSGHLIVSHSFPTQTKHKFCYFLKKEPVSLVRDDVNVKYKLTYGDLSPKPLENLVAFIEAGINPIVNSELNQEKWPETVVSDVRKHTQDICATLYSVQGQLKGKTLLSLPLYVDAIQENEQKVLNGQMDDLDIGLVTQIENIVSKWSQQIDEVLRQDSSKALQGHGFPTPWVELAFWENRVSDLKSIYAQLSHRDVKSIAVILEKIDSTHWPTFKIMFRNVIAALAEAEDILVHLRPLKKHLEVIHGSNFEDLSTHLKPMMHCVCLIWSHSKYYCSAHRIIVLLQEICNLFIDMARAYLGGSRILSWEPQESQLKVNIAVATLQFFRDSYEEHKKKLPVYFEPNVEPKNWDFLPHLVFKRFDRFLRRLRDIKTFFDTSVDLFQLERIEMGGSRGRELSAKIAIIHREYQDFYQKFSNINYDCIDPEDGSFERDFVMFEARVSDIDQRLSAIISNGFNDHTPESSYKQILEFGDLMDRPVIRTDFEPKFPAYLSLIEKDLNQIKEQFDDQILGVESIQERTFVDRNFPPYSASVHWAKGMLDRVRNHMKQLDSLPSNLGSPAEKNALIALADELKTDLTEFQGKTHAEWAEKFQKDARTWLAQPVLIRGEDGTIWVNFSRISTALKEVKYMRMARVGEIPKEGLDLEARSEEFRKNQSDIDSTARLYNSIHSEGNEFELALLGKRIQAVDEIIDLGLKDITWSQLNIEEYIGRLQEPVAELHQNLQKSQKNIEVISSLTSPWMRRPLFERIDGRNDRLLDLSPSAMEAKEQRYKDIIQVSAQIQALVTENLTCLSDADTDPRLIDEYARHIDGIVLEGIERTVAVSFGYLVDHTDSKLTPSPLLEVRIYLMDTDVIFQPSLDGYLPTSFLHLVQGLLTDISKQADLMERVRKYTWPSYLADIDQNDSLMEMRGDIEDRVQLIIKLAFDYTIRFEPYIYLWEEDQAEYLSQFLKYGRVLISDELEEVVPETEPTIEQFGHVIDKFEAVYLEVEKFQNEVVFERWFRLNMSPFKRDLLHKVRSWSMMFKKHLIETVVGGLADLDRFIHDCEKGLAQPLRPGDLQALISVMGLLHELKRREAPTDNMFKSIRGQIDLLKHYEIELPEDVFFQVEELPLKWAKIKKLGKNIKQQVSPLQVQQVSSIRKQIADFDSKQRAYREKFRRGNFLKPDCPFPYNEIDKTHADLVKLREEYEKIRGDAKLFEVYFIEPKGLHSCNKELRLAKNVWDYLLIVDSSIDDWKKTPWMEINVENMDMECKRMAKEVKFMDKDVKGWGIYKKLDETLRNMISSLKSVAELQNPSIKERHWEEIMKRRTFKFVPDENTTLADLLSLNLHNYEEEVKAIVDKAVKESFIERTLRELDSTWAEMTYDIENHPRTGTQLAKASEELVELLEDHENQLQNIALSKHMAFYRDRVEYWQNRLFVADQVISALTDVTRTWSNLESIFIATEDIRINLPEDSRRFDQIDADFKEVLKVILQTQIVIDSMNQPGLLPELERLRKELAICEKSLAQYLETKRLAFPRFYFVSSVDLLDILSKGNEPQSVQRHLAKLFDSMAKLEFEETPEGEERSKVAHGMWAKDGEHVLFDDVCDCVGPVEEWLGRLEARMKSTVRWHFKEAVSSYEEKPREKWIHENPAQVALCGSQIWWTTEVNNAFLKFEEGYETALKDYNRKQANQLSTLISFLLTNLSPQERQKIMTICTIDVHSRDVVSKLIQMKVDNAQAFQWQCQLRHRWDDAEEDCFGNICDAQFKYWYEYLGNQARLVITPLTDRCYITLSQSLHLKLGGAPAGPAGTGKTETTKDLGRSLGMMVYVFNCSEQMDYRSIGNIFKGLAQTGAWGCFDEFNRIAVEVLSVATVQVKAIQDALKDQRDEFSFMGETIALRPTVGLFITMNPGYAGRTELPENLKMLFRPCAMVVPDFDLICEIMLVAEGFQEARVISKKFITLYTLCRELLSKQDHYDWGLRAIKSVLIVAGQLKRSDPDRPEDQVLMRALRDSNLPKIVSADVPIFMGLIGDLFPGLEVPRKRDHEFEKNIKIAANQLGLQPEDNFIKKCVQLQELIDVRHSIFILGDAGTGKTQVWRTLFKTHQILKHRPVYNDLNPKAVTTDELYGMINPATREWKDGILTVLMRDQANLSSDGPKWIVLDGDIDPMWIESLNSVMDDNKVLTLASNERISLTKNMRLLFEIYTLSVATPATVSRAGILYLNPTDLGYNPVIASWIAKRESSTERVILTALMDKYVPNLMESFMGQFKTITPIPEISHVQLLCNLLESLLTPQNIPHGQDTKELYETYFIFACIWAFGAATFQDQLVDHRIEFSNWWRNEFKLNIPSEGTIFDYYIDPESKTFQPWTSIIPKFVLDPDLPLQASLVNTCETTRIRYFLDLLVARGVPVMLVGTAGSGKTAMINDKLSSLPESYSVANVPFNYYTTSEMLQKLLEKPLEKKAGRNYGPAGNKSLIYFIDDLNMPMVDAYGTVQPHTLIRQHLDYNHWYDKSKITLKEIHNVQYLACMNPKAGSFTINPRLQRHFSVFAVDIPGNDSLRTIYGSILQQHLRSQNVISPIFRTEEGIISASIALHSKVSSTFLPTASKFHYVFNLRDLSNIFQGVLFSSIDCLQEPSDLVRIWSHESSRVYGDKMADGRDLDSFQNILSDCLRSGFPDMDKQVLMKEPLMYFHFAQGQGDPKYMPVEDFESLSKMLGDVLRSYNEMNAAMNLVLFDDAVKYICRISRILESPRGNALLVGVGGSGKQSLSRLAAYISQLDVFQMTLRKGYGIQDLRNDLAQLYIKTGQKNMGTLFLMTDNHVSDEHFLVLINDMLASGEIFDLLSDDEVESVMNNLRTEVRAAGIEDSRENIWKFFIERVRKVLKCVICFSPVGNVLRTRARRFPAITNSTQIVWFHEWPQEALLSVSKRFVRDIEPLPEELLDPVAQFMAFAHTSVNEMSHIYLANEKRYNYTTPKSFLEQIDLYGRLVTSKNLEAYAKADRLESGLSKLESCAKQVESLKKVLAKQEVVLKEKTDNAEALVQEVSREKALVSKEKESAAVEEQKVAATAEEVAKIQDICRIELEKAEPALKAAYAALNTLNKANLTELKSFTSPPPDVVNVVIAVYILWAGTRTGKIPKDWSWNAAKTTMMKDIVRFLDELLNLEKEKITMAMTEAVTPIVRAPGFDPEKIRSKSFAAAGLCSYVLNVLKFNDVFQDVAPKRALDQANEALKKALIKLRYLKSHIRELEEKLRMLQREFDGARAAKDKVKAEADKTARVIDLANRLVGGLGAERSRWIQNVNNYRASTRTIPGDMLLVTAFVSYLGSFTQRYRVELLQRIWIPFLRRLQPSVPMSDSVDPLQILTDDAEIAQWNNLGLPSDRMSSENAAILINARRWPLMIDPQLQGIKWIKNLYGNDLRVLRLEQKGYLDVIEEAISSGTTVLIENIGEDIDPVLEPLMARNLVKRGTAIKMGDNEVDFNPNFRLILQTKLANPHYKPELQAQATLINFTVTREGLEDQLLAKVVKLERPDLEDQKSKLTTQQNDFKILLKQCEEELLSRLQSAQGNFLDDTTLVENLETTKRTSQDVEVKAKEAVTTSLKIDAAREMYRPAASRASLLYFILNDLHKIHPMYQFSLKAFSTVFQNALKSAPTSNEVSRRVENLIDAITFSVWMYTSRGLFERDKLIFTSQMAFQILLQKDQINPKDLEFLLRFPVVQNESSPIEFLNNANWGAVKSLTTLEEFRNIHLDIESSSKRWQKIVESETPELEKLPPEWKGKNWAQRLCLMRALRPDRMTYAINVFIEETLGSKYVRSRRLDFSKSFEESSNSTPIFFILSPGVDPLKEVESLGRKYGFAEDKGNFHIISLGQGQEVVAEEALDVAANEGHWVFLQNVHLVANWLPTLEKKLEQNGINSHLNYRVFISAEPAPSAEFHIIPQGVLESSIKITNEPPAGMLANLHKALDNFTKESLEASSKEGEFKVILFSLCYFHAVANGRKKFGTQGWNRSYPFNNGDLTISVNVLLNYLEGNNNRVPFEDLRYLFGEIMYGGHITDGWDRRLCRTYLDEFITQDLLDADVYYAPEFSSPPTFDIAGYHQYVDDNLPPESPILYGLHPNAEINYLTASSELLFKTVLELQPRDSAGGGGQVITKEDMIKSIVDDILEKLPEPFNMSEIQGRTEERSPYIVVALQECERMNLLIVEMQRSLTSLDLALKGELTITSEMEDLQEALFLDQVPSTWAQRAYPSTLGLTAWTVDLFLRIDELEKWTSDFILPASVWLGGLFNPQSFLTAIMQTTSRRDGLPLDKMCLHCDVTKLTPEEVMDGPEEGVYVHGLFLEGARWGRGGCMAESRLRELHSPMPVIHLKAITLDKEDDPRNMYECPVYKTRLRGGTYVWTFNLRTRERPSKWILGGVALLLQV